MSELYEKSLLKLELDQVLQLLSQCAGSPGGRDACLQIHPTSDLEDVKLMKSIVGDAVKVKAAGGIRDLAACLAMVEAGAERIGTSASIKITEEFKNGISAGA